MMQFISDNYVWIIIIVIVLLLALIGYLADKQGFGANMKKKDKKDIKPAPVEDANVEETIADDLVPAEELEFNDDSSLEKDLPIEAPSDDIKIDEPAVVEEAPSIEEPTVETPVEEPSSVDNAADELEPIEIEEFEPEKDEDFFPTEEKSEKDADLTNAIEESQTSDEDEIWKF